MTSTNLGNLRSQYIPSDVGKREEYNFNYTARLLLKHYRIFYTEEDYPNKCIFLQ